jgi:hypothetical protein
VAQSQKKPVVVYGASGYTGMLIIEQLVDLGIPFIAAGRDAARIRANMAERVAGLENAVYEVVEVEHEAKALTRAFTGAKVVCNTVGPFLRYYKETVTACVNAGCHYLDTSGEQAATIRLEREFGAAFASKGLLLAPAISYMYVLLQIAAELCLEQGGIDSLDCVCVPTAVPTVGSANSIMVVLLEPAFFLKDKQFVEWSLGDGREVVTPGFATTNLGLPWGGTPLPQYYLNDSRVRNCTALVGFSDRAMMTGLVQQAKQMKEQVRGKSEAERYAILDDFARLLAARMPPRERTTIHRSIDHVVARGGLKEVSATVIGVLPYVTTAALQAYSVSRLLANSQSTSGFASACAAFGHRQILSFLEDRGLVSHRIVG